MYVFYELYMFMIHFDLCIIYDIQIKPSCSWECVINYITLILCVCSNCFQNDPDFVASVQITSPQLETIEESRTCHEQAVSCKSSHIGAKLGNSNRSQGDYDDDVEVAVEILDDSSFVLVDRIDESLDQVDDSPDREVLAGQPRSCEDQPSASPDGTILASIGEVAARNSGQSVCDSNQNDSLKIRFEGAGDNEICEIDQKKRKDRIGSPPDTVDNAQVRFDERALQVDDQAAVDSSGRTKHGHKALGKSDSTDGNKLSHNALGPSDPDTGDHNEAGHKSEASDFDPADRNYCVPADKPKWKRGGSLIQKLRRKKEAGSDSAAALPPGKLVRAVSEYGHREAKSEASQQRHKSNPDLNNERHYSEEEDNPVDEVQTNKMRNFVRRVTYKIKHSVSRAEENTARRKSRKFEVVDLSAEDVPSKPPTRKLSYKELIQMGTFACDDIL